VRKTTEIPVLIVGAGPVGLGLALDLGWRGIPCLVIERITDIRTGIKANPRAAAVTPRTMEFCRRWGVAEAVRNSPFPKDLPFNIIYCCALDSFEILKQAAPSMNDRVPHPMSPETRQRCPQIWFDPYLLDGLAQYPLSEVHQPCELESFEDLGSEVRATIRDLATGEQRDLLCQYLVACDGSGSSVRRALGVATGGEGVLSYSVNAVLRLPNFLDSHDKGPAERYMFVDERGVWADLTVIDGREHMRFGLNGSRNEQDLERIDLAAEIRRAVGPKVDFETLALIPWRRREVTAESFRVGRVFLAGDAAHAMAPNLGLGMNTGMADSFDLGWKLEAALRGWAGSELLASYEIERRPAAVRNAGASTETFRRWVSSTADNKFVLDRGPEGEAARARVARQIHAAVPDGWDTIGLALGYRYDDSPICIPDGTPPPAERGYGMYEQTARPGARAPHAFLADARSTIDLFGRGFVLLRFADIDVAPMARAADECGLPLSVVDLREPALRKLYQANVALVRPDGHVAWRSDMAAVDPAAVIDRVRGVPQVSVRQTRVRQMA
jgi:2-polyprenyl-6-methoxyphenol hydroxylase-like FAD-dependent oxidoreductase